MEMRRSGYDCVRSWTSKYRQTFRIQLIRAKQMLWDAAQTWIRWRGLSVGLEFCKNTIRNWKKIHQTEYDENTASFLVSPVYQNFVGFGWKFFTLAPFLFQCQCKNNQLWWEKKIENATELSYLPLSPCQWSKLIIHGTEVLLPNFE